MESQFPATPALPTRDRERLGEVLQRLEPRLTAVALRLTRDREAARDVVQSAFEKVIRHRHTFRGRARVSTWIHRIVINEALMWLRTQRRRPEVSCGPLGVAGIHHPDAAPDPIARLVAREERARLRIGLSLLPGPERDVLVRCALGGQSYAQYAARVGLDQGAVKSRAFRARRRLGCLLPEVSAPPL